MKTYRISIKTLFATMLPLLFIMSSCNDDDDGGNPNPMDEIIQLQEVTLTGAQEVPANTSEATGTFRGTYNKTTRVMTYNITFQGITPTAMHFHRGAVGSPGPIVIPINPGSDPYSGTNPFRSPLSGSTPALTADQETELLSGGWFLNIHSSAFPDGEIRAQVLPQ